MFTPTCFKRPSAWTRLGVLGLLSCLAAAAAPITYSLTGSSQNFGPINVAFQLTTSDYVSPVSFNNNYTCSQLDSSLNCGSRVYLMRSAANDYIQFNANNNAAYIFYFAPNAFAATGIYTNTLGNNPATLTVSDGAVPEPQSVMMMLSGLAAIPLALRRRKKQQ
jgi:hypothetical protein